MFCKNCGQEISDGINFCPKCGTSLNTNDTNFVRNYTEANMFSNQKPPENKGLSVASLTLGVVGLLAWLLPLVGFPIIITGLILGIIGRKRGGKGLGTVGIVLCVITLILTTANSAYGAYLGYKGLLFNQQKEKVEQTPSEFTLRDENGNILMEGGIATVNTKTVTGPGGNDEYVVVINFTDAAAEEFATITEEYIGKCISIYLNDDLLYEPMVQVPITDGTCFITGSYSEQEALALAEKLNQTIR